MRCHALGERGRKEKKEAKQQDANVRNFFFFLMEKDETQFSGEGREREDNKLLPWRSPVEGRVGVIRFTPGGLSYH